MYFLSLPIRAQRWYTLTLSGQKLSSITGVKEDGLKYSPYISMTPMLTKDVRWISLPKDMIESNHTGGYCFSYSVKRQHRVSLVQLSVRHNGTVYNRFIISEHVAMFCYRYSWISQSIAEINNLFNARSTGYKF